MKNSKAFKEQQGRNEVLKYYDMLLGQKGIRKLFKKLAVMLIYLK
jgi:hypothetical protein